MDVQNKKTNKIKLIAELAFICLFLIIFIYIIRKYAPSLISILKSGDVEQIDAYLKQYGTAGKWLLVLLQVIETFSIFIPSTPVYICAGMMFGKLWGTIVCYVVNLILVTIIFSFACKMKVFTKKYFDLSKQKTVGPLLENAKHLDRMAIALCLIQIIPGGMIPLLISQTEISFKDFLKAMAIGSLPTVVLYVWMGDFLMKQNYTLIIVLAVVLIVAAAILYFERDKVLDWLGKHL